jgi:hypothetical protein
MLRLIVLSFVLALIPLVLQLGVSIVAFVVHVFDPWHASTIGTHSHSGIFRR